MMKRWIQDGLSTFCVFLSAEGSLEYGAAVVLAPPSAAQPSMVKTLVIRAALSISLSMEDGQKDSMPILPTSLFDGSPRYLPVTSQVLSHIFLAVDLGSWG